MLMINIKYGYNYIKARSHYEHKVEKNIYTYVY